MSNLQWAPTQTVSLTSLYQIIYFLVHSFFYREECYLKVIDLHLLFPLYILVAIGYGDIIYICSRRFPRSLSTHVQTPPYPKRIRVYRRFFMNWLMLPFYLTWLFPYCKNTMWRGLSIGVKSLFFILVSFILNRCKMFYWLVMTSFHSSSVLSSFLISWMVDLLRFPFSDLLYTLLGSFFCTAPFYPH